MYEGTKHTFAIDAAARKVPERTLQAFLGHRDVRSTRKYAKLADQAPVDVLRPPIGLSNAGPSEEAEELLGESVSLCGSLGPLPHLAEAHLFLAELFGQRGDPRRAG